MKHGNEVAMDVNRISTETEWQRWAQEGIMTWSFHGN